VYYIQPKAPDAIHYRDLSMSDGNIVQCEVFHFIEQKKKYIVTFISNLTL
jgi:hypothetical protein